TSRFVWVILSGLSSGVEHQGGLHGRLHAGDRAGDDPVVRLAGGEGPAALRRRRGHEVGPRRGRVHRRALRFRSQDDPQRAGGAGKQGRTGYGARPKKGGGRKRRIVVEPALAANFLKVLEDHTAGDPMRGDVKWTNLSRGEIAKRMGALGTPVSRDV